MGRSRGIKAGFEPAFETGAAIADPAAIPSGVSGGGSPSPQSGAGVPAPASPSGASAGASEPRTYRDEDVQRIVRERLAEEQKKYAPWKELGDVNAVKARLEKAERYEKAFQGDVPQVSPEEKELRELLTKQFPGIDQVKDLTAKVQAIERANQSARANAGRGIIEKLAADKLGVTDSKVLKMLENIVAASIAEDQESLNAWNSGDNSVIGKHFESALSSSLDPLFKSASARYSGGKAKDKAEVPPTMPKGGVSAPASNERRLTMEERREAAYKYLQELEGQG